ncbi:MAG: lipase family protein, partial [Bacteroidota bacterium]
LPQPLPDFEVLQSFEEAGKITKEEFRAYWGNNDTANVYIQNDVTIYRMTYQSTGLDGKPITLSGAILIPKNKAVKSVMAIQHATYFADSETPSVNQGFSVVTRKSIFAANGYIVFLPDYHGYGADAANIHPYHHAESLRYASKDMLLAGYEFLQHQEIKIDSKLFLAGYSEGAYATAALQQSLESKTDFPFTLIASSLGSGAYNLKATFEAFTSDITQPFGCVPCNAFFLQSYNEVYSINYSMSDYFLSPYDQRIADGLFLGNFDATAIAQQLTDEGATLFKPSFIQHYYQGKEVNWENALTENSIHDWQPKHPTFITHNEQDKVAPFFNSQALAELNQRNGNVQFLPIPNTNHFDGIFQWGILTMEYFGQF